MGEARVGLDGAVISPLRPLMKVVKKRENGVTRAVKKCELALAAEHRQRLELEREPFRDQHQAAPVGPDGSGRGEAERGGRDVVGRLQRQLLVRSAAVAKRGAAREQQGAGRHGGVV